MVNNDTKNNTLIHKIGMPESYHREILPPRTFATRNFAQIKIIKIIFS